MTKATTKRNLAEVPAGERDLISGAVNGRKPTKAAVKKLMLTSRTKMGKARPAKPAPAKAKTARQQIKETVAEVRAANEKAHDRRVENCGQAAAKALDPKAAERELRARITARALKLTGCNFEGIKNVDPAKAKQYAELLASGGVTPKAAEAATGLVERARWRVEDRLKEAGYKLRFERNPERVPGDRATSSLYYLEPA